MASVSFRRLSNSQRFTLYQVQSFGEIKNQLAALNFVTCDRIDIVRGPFIVETKEDMTSQSEMALIIHPPERPIYANCESTAPDMFEGIMADGRRVRMTCGHAVTPDNLYRFCLTSLKDSNATFRCRICQATWTFEEITNKAALSEDEKIFFRQRIDEITSVSSFTGQSIDKGATNDLLRNCGRVVMGYSEIPNVPSIRACPKCFKFIEHMQGCKTMTCSCGHVFCFSCLQAGTGSSLSCGSYSSQCNVAPVQQIV